MAYKLIWSPAARDDLHDMVVFIARDNPNRAMSFGYELISETDRLQKFPEFGRSVPEYRDDNIREIIFRAYRIVYRIDHERRLCEIARIWHSSRGLPQL
jgi:toxin ParE1/3/4